MEGQGPSESPQHSHGHGVLVNNKKKPGQGGGPFNSSPQHGQRLTRSHVSPLSSSSQKQSVSTVGSPKKFVNTSPPVSPKSPQKRISRGIAMLEDLDEDDMRDCMVTESAYA